MATTIDEKGTSFGATSLRRKSLHLQNLPSSALTENNDEAERLARRCELNNAATSTSNANTSEKRRSLGLGFLAQMTAPEIRDRITECIKLSTENKINVKNAFGLEIIDFMTYMIKKQDSNMSNLQVASTSLDVSTKIYGFRVDGIHTNLMKMVGGIDKLEEESPANLGTTDGVQGNHENGPDKKVRKEKKKYRQKIFSTIDSLKGTVEIMKPSLWMIGDDDSQTTDALYQVLLPNHANSRFYLHLYNDVLVDTVEQRENINTADVPMPQIHDFAETEICPPLVGFEFQGWTGDDEEEKEHPKEKDPDENNDNGFQFDFDASVASDNDSFRAPLNYFDVQDSGLIVDKCSPKQRPVEKIVDLCKVVINLEATKVSEYSFLQKNGNSHWAGPSHWKMKSFRNLCGTSKVVETCQQQRVRKRKEIELSYSDDAKQAAASKFAICKYGRKESKNSRNDWQEERNTLPRDVHYGISNAVKLYLHKLISVKLRKEDNLDATHVSDFENYNYNNENDTSNYCPDIPNDDYGISDDNNDENREVQLEDDGSDPQMILAGDNLVAAPKLTNKISIAYSIRAKKIDMRQLKRSIWKCLTSNNDKENLDLQDAIQQEIADEIKENKCFSDIYKILPDILTKTNMESLSFPISFVSLLHLANEKTLNIQSNPDMSDLIVRGN